MPDPPQNPKVNLAGSGTIPHVQRPDGEFVPVTGSNDGSINVTVSAESGTATLAEQEAQTEQLVAIAEDAATLASTVRVGIPIEGDPAVGVRIGQSVTLTTQPAPGFQASAAPAEDALGAVVRVAGNVTLGAGIVPVGEGESALQVAAYQGGPWSVTAEAAPDKPVHVRGGDDDGNSERLATAAKQDEQTGFLTTIAAAADVPTSSVVTAISDLGDGATLNTLAGYLAMDQTTQADILAKLTSIDATLAAKLDVPLSDLKTELQSLNSTSTSILGAVDGLEGSSTVIETNTGAAASSLAAIAAQTPTLVGGNVPVAIQGTPNVAVTSSVLPTGAATEASVDGLETLIGTTNTTLTGGSQKAIVRGGAKGATVATDVTSTAEGTDHQALDVQSYHGGGPIDPRDVRVNSADASTTNPVPILSTATRLNPSHVQLTSQDGFGRPAIVETNPVVQATFTTGMKAAEWESYTTLTGTVTTTAETDGLGYARTGANASSVAERVSVSSFTYRAGQSFEVLFTTVFSAPAVGGTQAVGAGSNDAVAVGYNGTAFGFLIRSGGRGERRILTINTASTTAENVTVTLDGNATLVAVTNSGNTVTTAREIAAGNYSAAGPGWDAYQLGSTVIFVARRTGPRTGSYTLTATTAVGVFSQQLAGLNPTDTWRARTADWNGDKLNGSGPSGATIDPTKGQIWKIVVAHLGFGNISLFWQDPTTEFWTLCHRESFANLTATPNLFNPTLRLWIYAAGAANITSAARSMLLACHGPVKLMGRTLAVPAASKTNVGTTLIPILSIRTERYDNGNANRSPFKPLVIMFTAATTGEVTIQAYLNATLTGANFGAHPTDPVLAYDTSATAFSGGALVGSFCTSRNGSGIPIDVSTYGLALPPGYVVTMVAAQNSGSNGTVIVAISGFLDCGCGSEN